MRAFRGAGACAAVACISALLAGCSSGESAGPRTETSDGPRPAERDASRTESYAGSTRSTTGAEGWTLLDIPEIGSLRVSCPKGSRRRVTFTVSPRGASSAVVVASSHGPSPGRFVDPGGTLGLTDVGAASQQTWQITPVTPSEVRVAVLVVSSMPAPAALGGQGCFASATGTVTHDAH